MSDFFDGRCSVCGSSVAVATETLDGYICEDCRRKLSPWFEDLEYTDTDDLKEQISLRERNEKNLKVFRPTRKFGESVKVLIDDNSRSFVVYDTMAPVKTTPDLITLDDVLDVSVDVDEECDEIGPDEYRYRYVFLVTVDLDHPYLDHIEFRLNDEALEYISSEKSFLGFGGFDPEGEEDFAYYQDLGDLISDVLNDLEDEDIDTSEYICKPGEFNFGDGESESANGISGEVVTCPWCGSHVKLKDDYICPNCGANL